MKTFFKDLKRTTARLGNSSNSNNGAKSPRGGKASPVNTDDSAVAVDNNDRNNNGNNNTKGDGDGGVNIEINPNPFTSSSSPTLQQRFCVQGTFKVPALDVIKEGE